MQDYTLYIENARIIDGSGAPEFNGWVYLEDGLIKAVGRDGNDDSKSYKSIAEKIIDAEGAVLAPGFIDVHSHSDVSLLAAPDSIGKISQGVTTEITGNCGLSVFPVTDLNRDHLNELYASYGVSLDWNTYAEYKEIVSQLNPVCNIVSLCGYNTLRAAVGGYEKQDIGTNGINQMKDILYESLRCGVAGVSTGLLYVPGKFASTEEIASVLSIAGEFDGIYTTHLRSEGERLVESVNEAVDIARKAGIRRLHISHLKTAGAANWHKIDEVMKMISQARASGLQVTADRYPYIESMTSLSVILPAPYDDMDDVTIMSRLASREEREVLRELLKSTYQVERWRTIRLVATRLPDYSDKLGCIIEDIAKDKNCNPVDVVCDLITRDSVNVMAAFAGMNAENLSTIIGNDYTACGTDESSRPANYSIGRSHPRGFGSFPEFFKLLKNHMPLEQIIQRVTSFSAAVFNLQGRGMIAPGYAADLVIFEPENFKANATFAEPHRIASGVHKVFVNGQLRYNFGRVIR